MSLSIEGVRNLYDIAVETSVKSERVKKLKAIVSIAPWYSDAHIELTKNTAKDAYDVLRDMDIAIEIAFEYLESIDINIEANAGHFYGIIETRPLMRLLHYKLRALIELEYTFEAISTCEFMLMLNTNDNMGVRYLLYYQVAKLGTIDEMMDIRERWMDEDALEFDFPLLNRLVEEGEDDAAIEVLKAVHDKTDYLYEGIMLFLEGAPRTPSYQYGSVEHVVHVLQGIERMVSPDLFEWLITHRSVEPVKTNLN